MESVNVATLAGNITSSASRLHGKNQSWVSFDLTTYRVVRDGDRKVKVPEVHEVRMFNPGSILDHLKSGKFAVIVGRYCPDNSDDTSYMHASTVTFPTKGDF